VAQRRLRKEQKPVKKENNKSEINKS